MGLRVKQHGVRLIWADGEALNKVDSVEKNPGKIFAVIGPFDEHTSEPRLQDALIMLCRGANVEETP